MKETMLINYQGDMKNVVIPEEIKMIMGEEVAYGTEFEELDRAMWKPFRRGPFSRNEEIETVTMGDNVTVIGPKAFEHCTNLKSIKLSSSLRYIGLSAFMGCRSLKELYLPHSLSYVADWAFAYCHFDKVVYDGTLLEADDCIAHYADLFTDMLITNDAILNFKNGKYFIEDYNFPGTLEEWKSRYSNHWLNRRARRIHTVDGKVIENN